MGCWWRVLVLIAVICEEAILTLTHTARNKRLLVNYKKPPDTSQSSFASVPGGSFTPQSTSDSTGPNRAKFPNYMELGTERVPFCGVNRRVRYVNATLFFIAPRSASIVP